MLLSGFGFLAWRSLSAVRLQAENSLRQRLTALATESAAVVERRIRSRLAAAVEDRTAWRLRDDGTFERPPEPVPFEPLDLPATTPIDLVLMIEDAGRMENREGEEEAAASLYRLAAEESEDPAVRRLVLFRLAALLGRRGRREEAVRAFTALLPLVGDTELLLMAATEGAPVPRSEVVASLVRHLGRKGSKLAEGYVRLLQLGSHPEVAARLLDLESMAALRGSWRSDDAESGPRYEQLPAGRLAIMMGHDILVLTPAELRSFLPPSTVLPGEDPPPEGDHEILITVTSPTGFVLPARADLGEIEETVRRQGLLLGAATAVAVIAGFIAIFTLLRGVNRRAELARLQFPVQITLQLRDADVGHLPVFTAAFQHPTPEVREAAVQVASRWLDENNMDAPELWDLILGATGDYSPPVQLAAVSAIDGNAGTARRLKVAAAGAGSSNPQIRSAAILTLFGWPLEAKEVTEDLHDSILTLLECGVVRAEALATSLSLAVGGKLAKRAVLLLLQSDQPLAMLRAAEAVQADRVEVNEDIVRALVLAATNAYTGERDEPWKMTYDAMFAALKAHPAEVRRVGLATFMPLLSAINASPAGMRREYAMNHLLTLLMACTVGWEETSELLLDAYQTLVRDADRATWLKAFGDRMGPRAQAIALELRDSEDGDLRLQAISMLTRTLPPDRRAEVLGRHLNDSDPRIRYTVLNALAGNMPREALAEAARAGIRDEDELVRRASVAPLVKALGRDSLIWLREAVQEDPDLTNLAVQAVKEHLSVEDTREFASLLLAGVEDVEQRAVILAVAGSTLSDEMVLDALATRDPTMIRWIAPIAGERYLLQAWPLLLPFRDQDIRAAAALERIRAYHLGLKEYDSVRGGGSGEAIQKAKELATSEDPDHRRAAALALGALRDPAGISLLLDLVKDEDEAVRMAALAALARLGGEERR